MNRINLGPLATVPQSQHADPSKHKSIDSEVESKSKNVFDLPIPSVASSEHSVFVPMHYERNYSYPLVVWLHADGEDAQSVLHAMPDLSMCNYVAVGPQAPCGDVHRGFVWEQEVNAIDRGEQAIFSTIDDACRRLNVASDKIFLAGRGAGGAMAFRIAFRRPELFAGVLSLNGPIPEGQMPLCRLNACRKMPVFWAHCRNDQSFSEDDLCGQLRLLHIAGFAVTLRQYPCGEELMPQVLGDANSWMMEIVNGYKQE